jgi:hypothetical protein
MPRRLVFIVAVVLLVLAGSAAPTLAAFVNFDGLPASTNLAGVPNNPASVLDTDLASLGIVFGLAGVSTGVAVINNPQGAFSDPQFISGLNASGQLTAASSGNMYFSFVTPNTLVPSVTDFVSFRIGDDGGDIDSWTINAYGPGNFLLNTQMLSGAAFQLFTLSLPGINRIEILNTTGDSAGFGVDDLSFNTPGAAVPEPATLGMLGVALAGLGSRRFRHRRRR